MKRIIIIALVCCFLYPTCPGIWAQDIEKDELKLQVLEAEIVSLRTAVQRDNAQIAFLQERIGRLNLEVEKRLAEANKLRAEIQKVKDGEKKDK